MSAALDRVDAEPREIQPTRHPLIRHLPAALALASAHAPGVASVLEPVAELLPWRYGYQDRPDASVSKTRWAGRNWPVLKHLSAVAKSASVLLLLPRPLLSPASPSCNRTLPCDCGPGGVDGADKRPRCVPVITSCIRPISFMPCTLARSRFWPFIPGLET